MKLHWQILIAILLGGLFGWFLPGKVGYVSWLGTLFLRLLKMVVIPLVFCSIVSAIAGIKSGGKLGRLGAKAMGLYTLSSFLAIVLGLFLVNTIQPGKGVDVSSIEADQRIESLQKRDLRETLLAIVPDNVFKEMAAFNLLPIVFFAIFTGVVLAVLRREDVGKSRDGPSSFETLYRVFDAGYHLMMKMTGYVILFAPLGIFGLIADGLVEFGGETEKIMHYGKGILLHFAVVSSGLAIHMLITLSLILWFIGRCNPFKHLRNMKTVLLTSFSTASSNATLPITLKDVVEKDGVSEETARFVLPLGATVNMDGTSLYECAVVLFIAQAFGIELSLMQQAIAVLMVFLTAIGTAGIPMASLVMIVIVLNALGLPEKGLALVILVDRPLDMLRTMVNVYGDTCCTVVTAKTEGEDLNI